MTEVELIKIVNISSIVILIISFIIIEIAYKKDSTKLFLIGVEVLVLAILDLLTKHIPKLVGCRVRTYVIISACIFALYYILKIVIIHTIKKHKELKNLSDIREIVKEEPIKREAKRKNKKEEGK